MKRNLNLIICDLEYGLGECPQQKIRFSLKVYLLYRVRKNFRKRIKSQRESFWTLSQVHIKDSSKAKYSMIAMIGGLNIRIFKVIVHSFSKVVFYLLFFVGS